MQDTSRFTEKLKEKEKTIQLLKCRISELDLKINDLNKLNEQIEESKVTAKKDTVKAEIKARHLQRDIELRDIQIVNLKES